MQVKLFVNDYLLFSEWNLKTQLILLTQWFWYLWCLSWVIHMCAVMNVTHVWMQWFSLIWVWAHVCMFVALLLCLWHVLMNYDVIYVNGTDVAGWTWGLWKGLSNSKTWDKANVEARHSRHGLTTFDTKCEVSHSWSFMQE